MHWYLATSLSNPGANIQYSFDYGSSGDIPITGKWSGNSTTTAGVVRNDSVQPQWFLNATGNNANPSGNVVSFYYGSAYDIPVAGDWDGDLYTTAGIVRTNSTNLQWFLSDTLITTLQNGSSPPSDNNFYFGAPGMTP